LQKCKKTWDKKVYDFDFIDVRKDSTYKISDFAGKVILLNFWGTYCGPCIEEFPDLKRIESDHPDKVWVIALSDENRERIMKFAQKDRKPKDCWQFCIAKMD